MSMYQLLFAMLVGGVATAVFYARNRDEETLQFEFLKPGQKTCLMVPLAMACVVLLLLFDGGLQKDVAARLCLLFFHISIPLYFLDNFAEIGGCFGVEVDEARLSFSYEPTDYSVTVESWDRSEGYTLHASKLQDHRLPLAPYSAYYTVQGGFDTVSNTHYEMAFYFDIGQPIEAECWEMP